MSYPVQPLSDQQKASSAKLLQALMLRHCLPSLPVPACAFVYKLLSVQATEAVLNCQLFDLLTVCVVCSACRA